MRDLKTVDPEGYKTLKGQDDQLAAIKRQRQNTSLIKTLMHF